MRTEEDSISIRVFHNRLFQPEAKFEAGTFPGKPDQIDAGFLVERFQVVEGVCAGGNSDSPVWVQVVHMLERQEGMERGVNGGGARVIAEGAEVIEVHHLILELHA